MSMLLQCKETSKPHPEGIYCGVCVDVVDLGLVETDFQGQRKLVPKVRLVFETEYRDETGKAGVISKTFTASLHQKARLSEYIGKWRGRPVVPGESIDLAKLIGANCTLVISKQQNMVGRTYAAIDAVSKPTKRVVASGTYDPAETRRRIAEWKARDGVETTDYRTTDYRTTDYKTADHKTTDYKTTDYKTTDNRTMGPLNPVGAAFPGVQQQGAAGGAAPKSGAAGQAAGAPANDFDPEVGF